MTRRIPYVVCALAGTLLAGASSAVAQQAPLSAAPAYKQEAAADIMEFQARVDQAAHLVENEPVLKDLTHEQRKSLIEFVAGNMLFALHHELGHALVSEMGLPVLGREEDAVDDFAVLAMLSVGDAVSNRVLNETISGWFLDAERNIDAKTQVPFYNKHSIDKVRAYDIVCLMVGFDPDKFAAAATKAKMPLDRQQSCAGDYSNAAWSWTTVLRLHLRPAAHPKQKFTVKYGSGQGQYDALAKAFQTVRLLEIVSELANDRYIWRRPIHFEMRTCGYPNADWDLQTQTVLGCYEMAQDFAYLYHGYGLGPAAQPAVATPATPPAKVTPAAKTK